MAANELLGYQAIKRLLLIVVEMYMIYMTSKNHSKTQICRICFECAESFEHERNLETHFSS